MRGRLNAEQLMADALDGCINTHDRARLEDHLERHPSERAVFERMRRLDHALRIEPVTQAPPAFTSRVMAALPYRAASMPSSPPARPPSFTGPASGNPRVGFTAPQVVFLVTLAATALVLIGFIFLAMLSLSPDAVAQTAPPTAAAIWRSAAELLEGAGGAIYALLHILVTLPYAWVFALVVFFIASLWARVVLVLLLPTLRLVLA